MQQLINRSTDWLTLILIAHLLVGCASTQVAPELPPIYVMQSDIQCMAIDTKRQIVAHNCKVDYDPAYCNIKRK